MTKEGTSPETEKFFTAIPGKTKEIRVGWHDYEDDRSLEKIIHIPVDEDPEVGATSFLMEYVPGRYDFESAKESWRVEVGPVFDRSVGDGSDAPFDILTFYGTKEEAETIGKDLSSEWQQRTGGWNRDLGSFSVGASVIQRE